MSAHDARCGRACMAAHPSAGSGVRMSLNMITPSGWNARHGCGVAGASGGGPACGDRVGARLQGELDGNIRGLGAHAERVLIRVAAARARVSGAQVRMLPRGAHARKAAM